MMTDVRKLMEGAVEKLSPAKAQEIARSLVAGGGREQVTKTAHELMEWSNKNRERVREIVQREVRSQLKSFGVATRDEVEALKKRVRELERAVGPAPKRPAAKKAPARKTAAKKSTA